jgi:nitroimidazol reductase NimA-like FMN-containing flavoprotein (pyridoxamine 5'-phosphate oxidase superfamily)
MSAATTPKDRRNLDGYGAPIIDWSRVQATLEDGVTQAPDTGGPNRHTHWLATVNPDGRPHVMPLGVVRSEGAFYFTSGPGARKTKNLAANPRVTLTVATHPFDLVIEGTATRVTDEAKLERIAATFGAGGWAPTVRDGGLYHEFSAPSAGPPPWYVFEVVPETVYALGTSEPYGATRFDF